LTVILKPRSGESIVINWWNWRPTVALLVRAGILPGGDREERCLGMGGGYFTESEAMRAAAFVENLLADMKPDQRVLFDGEITDEAWDHTKPINDWDQEDTWNAYSARYDVLKMFAAFCRRSGGFNVY
jgi:hypothetical protein